LLLNLFFIEMFPATSIIISTLVGAVILLKIALIRCAAIIKFIIQKIKDPYHSDLS